MQTICPADKASSTLQCRYLCKCSRAEGCSSEPSWERRRLDCCTYAAKDTGATCTQMSQTCDDHNLERFGCQQKDYRAQMQRVYCVHGATTGRRYRGPCGAAQASSAVGTSTLVNAGQWREETNRAHRLCGVEAQDWAEAAEQLRVLRRQLGLSPPPRPPVPVPCCHQLRRAQRNRLRHGGLTDERSRHMCAAVVCHGCVCEACLCLCSDEDCVHAGL